MLILRNITYTHPSNELLFDKVNLTLAEREKAALIGNNGAGKSFLLKIIAGLQQPGGGNVNVAAKPYYVPQLFGQFNHLTVAQALQIDGKLNALHNILQGDAGEENFNLLADDWNIEERCQESLALWDLKDVDLSQKMETLSGGQKTRVFLAGIAVNLADFVLLDEPSNHLDAAGRSQLYGFIDTFPGTMLAVSHDRTLLNRLNITFELSRNGIKTCHGNYDFYRKQKQIEEDALTEDIKNQAKSLRKACETERETMERQQRRQSRGRKDSKNAGIPKALMDRRKSSSENTAGRLKSVHAEKINELSQTLAGLRSELPGTDAIRFGFDNSALHKGKILIDAQGINFAYGSENLWIEALDLRITSGERLCLDGSNGSGKTTLIKLILGELCPTAGKLLRSDFRSVYIDQDYSILNVDLTVYEQAQAFNQAALPEHEVKTRLNRFLFTKDAWNKSCHNISGGEKMRLALCCLTLAKLPPDVIVLDEPTNNLDIQNIEVLTSVLDDYQGTIIAVSHDRRFLEEIGIERGIAL